MVWSWIFKDVVMEMLEIFNEKGEKLGLTKSKEDVRVDGDWHRAVCAF